MSLNLRVWLAIVIWVVVITLVHLGLNTRVFDFSARARSSNAEEFRVGFLPVT